MGLSENCVIFTWILVLISTFQKEVQADCGGKPADVVFVLDASGSIWNPHFKQQLRFVSSIIQEFDISPFHTRVSVLTFGDHPRVHVGLTGHTDKSTLVQAVQGIPQTRGSTATGKALRKARDLITEKGRHGVAKLMIVFTDGASDNVFETRKEATLAHITGINVFAIGIGKGPRKEELRAIASNSQYVFTVSSFPALKSIKSLLSIKACEVEDIAIEDEGYNHFEQGCGGKAADVIFVLDSSNSIWKPDFYAQLRFVQDVTSVFQMDDGHTQVGVVTFSDKDKVKDAFKLNSYHDQASVISAIGSIKQTYGDTRTGQALHHTWRRAFSVSHGARKDVPHIAVVITDGKSSDPDRTRLEAHRARAHGIQLFAIGVGRHIDLKELHSIAGRSDKNVFTVDNYNALDSIKEMLAIKTCKATRPPTTARTTTTITTTTPMPTTTADKMVVDQACAFGARADIVFGMSGVRKTEDSNTVLKFIREVASGMDVGKDQVRIGLVPKQCSGFPAMHLKSSAQKNDVIEELELMASSEQRTSSVLKYMRKNSFSSSNGARQDESCRRIAVLVLDENVDDLSSALREARKAETRDNVEIYVVGVGKHLNPTHLNALATSPPSQHVFHVASFKDFPSVKDRFLNTVCTVPGL